MPRVFVRAEPAQFCTCKRPPGFTSHPDYTCMPECPGLWVCANCGWPTQGGWLGYLRSKKQRRQQ